MAISGCTAVVSISLLEKFQHKGIAYLAMKKIINEHNYHYLAQKKIMCRQSDYLKIEFLQKRKHEKRILGI